MYALIFAALSRVVAWCLGSGVIKWGFTALLWFGLALLLDLVLDLLPAWFSPDGIASASAVFTPEVWFFVDYFQLQTGLSMLLGAYVARFLIRRIPFIG